MAWSDSPAASSRDPGHFWTVPWFSHLPLNKESSPSPCQLGTLLLRPQWKGGPLLLLLGKQASLPGTTLFMSTLHVSIFLSAQDSLLTTRRKAIPVRKQIPPAVLPNSRSSTEYLKRRSRPPSYCFQAGVVGWGPGVQRGFCADPSTV